MGAILSDLRPVRVVGVGLHRYQRAGDSTFVTLGLTAVRAALADAGMEWPDVEAAYTGTALLGFAPSRTMLRYLGTTGIPMLQIENASASGSTAFRLACLDVATGVGDVAIAIGVDQPEMPRFAAAKAGVRLPISSYGLQAFVSEPVKPCLDTVLLSPATGTYLSQSDKGELVIGAGLDIFLSYAQRGSLPWMERAAAGVVELFPGFSRMRFLRQWAGLVDVTHDSTPILGRTPVDGLYVNGGWGTGGFKAIPAGGWCLAHLMATGQSHPLAAGFGLERFQTGALIDEASAAGIAH